MPRVPLSTSSRGVVAPTDHPVADRELRAPYARSLAERAPVPCAARAPQRFSAPRVSLSRAIITACSMPTSSTAAAHSATARSARRRRRQTSRSVPRAAPIRGSDSGGASCSAASARRSAGSRWRMTSVSSQRAELAADRAQPSARLRPTRADRGRRSRSPSHRLARRPRAAARSAASAPFRPRRARSRHAVGQPVAELLEIDQQPVERARRDPGLLGQLARAASVGATPMTG